MDFDNVILKVKDISKYIKTLLDYDPLLSNFKVEGEISNYKRHSSGHLYFSIKDDYSRLNCVMFKGNTFSLNFEPKDGMNVVLSGHISLFEKNGNYQMYVEHIEKKGVGQLYEKYQELLNKLKLEGYFEEERKKKIPFLCKRVAVITSKTGAAVKDIISVIKRRNPNIEIIVCPVSVQGKGSEIEIANMINRVNKYLDVDVIITGRGGGSIEELWAFNEEIVAKAIYNSTIPVISAVGHEIDFTIADFVSDLRAPTPSAAGELVSKPLNDLKYTINLLSKDIQNKLNNKINEYDEKLINISQKKIFKRKDEYINNHIIYLDKLEDNINKNIKKIISAKEKEVTSIERIINNVSVENILNRGFALVYCNNELIKDFSKNKIDDTLKIVTNKDEAKVKIVDIRKKEK